jgi:acetate kinase
MRVLLASDDPRAATAIDQFTYRIAVEAGGMISALGGIDGLVFTAGIGERSSVIRSKVCARLRWLGLRIDDEANRAGATRIAAPRSRIDVRVVATDEEAMIARHTRDLIDGQEQPN